MNDQSLIIAGHPNLLRYAAFRADWPGVKTAPSAIAAVDIRNDQVTRLYHGDGSILSGSTAAILTDQHLVAGAAYDSGLLVCDRAGPI